MTGIAALNAAGQAAGTPAAGTSQSGVDAGLFAQLLKAQMDASMLGLGTESGSGSLGGMSSLLNVMLMGSLIGGVQGTAGSADPVQSEELARMQQELEALKASQAQPAASDSAVPRGGIYVSRAYTPDVPFSRQPEGALLASPSSNWPKHTARHDAVVSSALTRVGDPYSQSRRGQGNYVDCSYLTKWAYAQQGITIPSIASEQARWCVDNGYVVPQSDLQAGDLVFWYRNNCSCGRYDEIHHVGIYLGGGQVLEASSSKGEVVINDLWEGLDDDPWHVAFFARPQT